MKKYLFATLTLFSLSPLIGARNANAESNKAAEDLLLQNSGTVKGTQIFIASIEAIATIGLAQNLFDQITQTPEYLSMKELEATLSLKTELENSNKRTISAANVNLKSFDNRLTNAYRMSAGKSSSLIEQIQREIGELNVRNLEAKKKLAQIETEIIQLKADLKASQRSLALASRNLKLSPRYIFQSAANTLLLLDTASRVYLILSSDINPKVVALDDMSAEIYKKIQQGVETLE